MNRSIYDLSLEGLEIEQLLLDSLGQITPEVRDRMDDLLMASPATMESAAAVVTQLQMSAKMAEEESDRLRARSKEFQSQAEALKERMVYALDKAFGGKVKTPKWTIYTQKSADRTIAELVPGITPEWLHKERPDLVRVKMELNREKAVEEFTAGRNLPELLLFEFKRGTKSVRIR